MIVEVSDYHCPFCRRHTLTTQPQIDTNYVTNGKMHYVFIDYPIAGCIRPRRRRTRPPICAGEQGKYWEMHKLFRRHAAA